jgi:hypothetical protein
MKNYEHYNEIEGFHLGTFLWNFNLFSKHLITSLNCYMFDNL